MIVYDPHNWSRQIFALNGTVLRRVLGRVALVALITLILSLLKLVSESEVLDQFPVLRQWTWLNSLEFSVPKLEPIGHTVLGLALSMLITFRSNAANTRYWEGRGHWGMLVNTSRPGSGSRPSGLSLCDSH
jgi:putative membrane protein